MKSNCVVLKIRHKTLVGRNANERISALNDMMSAVIPAFIGQQLKDGKYFYNADRDGTFEVRVLDGSGVSVRWAKKFIEREGFEVVSEGKLEDCW